MFLLKFGVPQTCFEIALTWSSGEDQTLETQRIHRKQLIGKSYNFLMEEWIALLKRIL